MSGAIIILALVVLAFLPAALAVFWFRHRKLAMPLHFVLIFLASGVLSMILALVVQSGLPQNDSYSFSRWTVFIDLFLRISLTEEGAKLLFLLGIFALIRRFSRNIVIFEGFAAGAGLLAGFAFAAVESAVYAAADSSVVLLRMISAVPLHGACGIRCGLAASGFASKPRSALGRFTSAIVLHSFYDFLLPLGGFRAALGILLALVALVSSAQSIRPSEL
ncbi:MAG: PrsW family intramembrane metalloprotease [Spirochaetaceae bacterium]|jgi:RsiW-degrading membrane proteinase PrsW (M82 family)|nr:PrsW family intramembrane metalloprotease [Spirochaetaceae bacterium]